MYAEVNAMREWYVLIPTYFPSYRLKFYMKSTQIRAWYRSNFQPLRWVCSSVPSSSDFNCFKKSKSFYNGNLSLECGVHWVDMYILLLFSFFPLLQNPLNSIRLRSLNAFHGTKNSPFPLFPYLRLHWILITIQPWALQLVFHLIWMPIFVM